MQTSQSSARNTHSYHSKRKLVFAIKHSLWHLHKTHKKSGDSNSMRHLVASHGRNGQEVGLLSQHCRYCLRRHKHTHPNDNVVGACARARNSLQWIAWQIFKINDIIWAVRVQICCKWWSDSLYGWGKHFYIEYRRVIKIIHKLYVLPTDWMLYR